MELQDIKSVQYDFFLINLWSWVMDFEYSAFNVTYCFDFIIVRNVLGFYS